MIYIHNAIVHFHPLSMLHYLPSVPGSADNASADNIINGIIITIIGANTYSISGIF